MTPKPLGYSESRTLRFFSMLHKTLIKPKNISSSPKGFYITQYMTDLTTKAMLCDLIVFLELNNK